MFRHLRHLHVPCMCEIYSTEPAQALEATAFALLNGRRSGWLEPSDGLPAELEMTDFPAVCCRGQVASPSLADCRYGALPHCKSCLQMGSIQRRTAAQGFEGIGALKCALKVILYPLKHFLGVQHMFSLCNLQATQPSFQVVLVLAAYQFINLAT